MSEALSKILHGDFDSVFHEVTQLEKVAWTTEVQLRLFYLKIRNNKFNPEEMKTLCIEILVNMFSRELESSDSK